MMRHLACGLVAIALMVLPAQASDRDEMNALLDTLHSAAAKADWERYFALYSDNATFIGTDITEFWTVDELKAYAKGAPNGWTYHPDTRHIDSLPGGDSAYFHETLRHDQYGLFRGTGVLIRTKDGWRIAQYHLTLPIPNDRFFDVARGILPQ